MNFLLVDDHSLIVQALSVLLKAKFEGAQVLTGSTAEDARALVREHSEDTDLLILDLNLPGVQTPTSLLEELVQTNPALKILVLSGIVDQANIMRVLQLGAAGFVPKSLDTNMLSDAITFVLQGGVYIPTQLLSQSQKEGFFTEAAVEMQQSTPQVRLTQRQQEVLHTLARGLPVKRICRELNLSEGTVKRTSRPSTAPSVPATARKRSSRLVVRALTSFSSPLSCGFPPPLGAGRRQALQRLPAFAESRAWLVLRCRD